MKRFNYRILFAIWGRDVARDNIRSLIFRRSRRANIGAGATAMIAAADE
jgi:hypothetical protein